MRSREQESTSIIDMVYGGGVGWILSIEYDDAKRCKGSRIIVRMLMLR